MALSTDIINKDRGFQIFRPNELYGPNRPTGWVPNVDDLIVNDTTKGFDRVVFTNYAVPSWEVEPWGGVGIVNPDNRLHGHYPLRSDRCRVFVDSSKIPATMVLDNEIVFNGPDVDGVRVLRGIKITDDAEILSGFYKDGALKFNYLPVKTISVEGNPTVVKQALPGSCLAEVQHGEDVTMLVYSDDNVVQVIVGSIVKTNLMMAQETPSKTVMGIKLVSPFIRDDNGRVLTLPIEIPLESIPIWCDVMYSDCTKRFPIDGARVKLNGLRNAGAHDTYYIASNAGNELPCVLTYELARGETYAGDNLVGNTIAEHYTAVTENTGGGYSMKAFAIPVWLDANRGYRIQYLLYNLTRGLVYDATAAVNYTTGTSFDPLLMGVKQRLNVQIEVGKLDPKFKGYVHPQSFSITLVNPGNELNTNFKLEYLPNGLVYGDSIWAEFKYSNVNYSELDVSCKKATLAEWLDALYTPSYPLYDRRNENGPMEPTHFEVHVGGQVYTYPIEEWSTKKVINYKVALDDVLVIRWIRRTPTDNLQLAASSMLAHHIE